MKKKIFTVIIFLALSAVLPFACPIFQLEVMGVAAAATGSLWAFLVWVAALYVWMMSIAAMLAAFNWHNIKNKLYFLKG